ncbi:DUF4376 domain-containing protein [Azospirillum sp.]|uniref:DUF4376 domain-containing protein n=1 Tax=Azospirillum sp. TaxID=34012 RepID=UPI002D612F26|nr:DUF4376 domain-containing protein [Azospirillum sp.]HYD66997.1 DUF4376 domain-containing protein [Azospirillum sp.]
MLWARIDEYGRAAEFITFDPSNAFHPDTIWVQVPDLYREWVDTEYIQAEGGSLAPPSLDHLKQQAKARVAARRFMAETGGLTLPDGTGLRTDRESQAMIGNAVALAQLEPDAPVAFKAASGWVTLTGAQMQAVGRAVGAHVRACFAREQAIGALIDAADTVDEVLATYDAEKDEGWPA